MQCKYCGNEVMTYEVPCPSCGFNHKEEYCTPDGKRNNRLMYLLLSLFLGWIGIADLAGGMKKRGIIKLCLGAGGMILGIASSFIAAILSILVIGFLLIPIAIILCLIPCVPGILSVIDGIMIMTGKDPEELLLASWNY